MKYKPSISVIIPLYNGEKFIEKCLDSIVEQKGLPIEIIIVNDGSSDSSVNIVMEYGERNAIPVESVEEDDERDEALIKNSSTKILLVHQKNQGQGAARNTGIRMAQGRYLAFLDQDDTLELGIFSRLIEKAENENADITIAGYRRVGAEGKIIKEVKLQRGDWTKYKVIAPWSKLYRTDFIRKNNVLFLPVVLGEDIYFLMKAYSYMPKVAVLDEIGYNWFDNMNSVSNTAHRKLEVDTSLLKLFDMLESLENSDVLKNDKLYEYFLLKTAIWNILYTARSNLYSEVMDNNSRIWKWFEQHFKNYETNPYISISRPYGEEISIRLIVWGYMKLRKWKIEKQFIKLLCKK